MLAAALALGAATIATGQSSSLYIVQDEPAAPAIGQVTALSPVIAANSYFAVRVPEPRQFAENDLITVVIRESFKTDLEASLETEKDYRLDGEISEFIDLDELFKELRLRPYDFPGGIPSVGVDLGNEWEGEGEYSREESMTGRITARVVDVKPNGTLVLEARQSMIHDREELMITLTGTCRAADVTVDNTVLSTELFDLHLDKQHKGELKKSTKKGLLPTILDAIFGP
jgi:flagellar L-ring protein precursor FlgH